MSKQKEGPELYFGLVGAAGTDLKEVSRCLTSQLSEVNYKTETLILSELICATKRFSHLKKLFTGPEEKRIEGLMEAGTEIRNLLTGSAVARLAILKIRQIREEINKKKNIDETDLADVPLPRQAFIIKSLKHPKEVESLRNLFGKSFFLISVYEPKNERIENLKNRIGQSHIVNDPKKYEKEAKRLIEKDELEKADPLGQRVSETFHRADYFINKNNNISEEVKRIIRLLFGAPFVTPTKDEYGMVHAQAAALRSSDLSRQVGAVIATSNGEIISAGCNEVPKAGGGTFWEGEEHDDRDFVIGFDPSVERKNIIVQDVLKRLKKGGWLNAELFEEDLENLTKEVLFNFKPSSLEKKGIEQGVLKRAEISNLLEFGRIIHAEMLAITDAARRGLEVKNQILYSTTFPCHMCARHIIGAGIKEVVYIEPYPKSLTKELYKSSVRVDFEKGCKDGAVNFRPFMGLAPNNYFEFFKMGVRKNEFGKAKKVDDLLDVPRKISNYKLSNPFEIGYVSDLSALY